MKDLVDVLRNIGNGIIMILCFLAIMGFAIYGFLHFAFGV